MEWKEGKELRTIIHLTQLLDCGCSVNGHLKVLTPWLPHYDRLHPELWAQLTCFLSCFCQCIWYFKWQMLPWPLLLDSGTSTLGPQLILLFGMAWPCWRKWVLQGYNLTLLPIYSLCFVLKLGYEHSGFCTCLHACFFLPCLHAMIDSRIFF